jgi:Ca2+-binding RTX toxin-like protein
VGNIAVSGASASTGITVADALSVGTVTVTTTAGTTTVTLNNGTLIGTTMTGGAGVEVFVGTGAADTISTGAGNDTVTGGSGNDTITLGTGADTISFTGVSTAANGDTVTDFATTADILGLSAANTTVATAAGAAAVVEDEATAAANANGAAYDLAAALAGNTNTLDLVTLDGAVLTNIANADLSAATDGTELLKALVAAGVGNTALNITLDNNGDSLYIATDDGVNGYLYLVTADAGDTTAEADDIVLIGTFSGDTDFGDIVAGNTIMVA